MKWCFFFYLTKLPWRTQIVIETGWVNVFDRLNAVAVTLPGNMPLRFALEKKAEVNIYITRDWEKEQHPDMGTIFFIRGWQVTVSNLDALITHCQLNSWDCRAVCDWKANTLRRSSKFSHTSKLYKVNCWSL